jgi:hypothetical protein
MRSLQKGTCGAKPQEQSVGEMMRHKQVSGRVGKHFEEAATKTNTHVANGIAGAGRRQCMAQLWLTACKLPREIAFGQRGADTIGGRSWVGQNEIRGSVARPPRQTLDLELSTVLNGGAASRSKRPFRAELPTHP